ncbi:unnamed protein product [Ilex paraguariensis]|uniref:Uncharacterized protein n=1 Tax=Ilex paraguariensis TaxID=185542 RepID=A0ABC8RFC2_9AQUA
MEEGKGDLTALSSLANAIWRATLAGSIIWLVVNLIMKELVKPSHHVEPVFRALSVFFCIALIAVAIALICIALLDCQNICKAVMGWMAPSPSTTVAQHGQEIA